MGLTESVLYVIQHRDWSGAETAQAGVIAADPDALVACPPGSPTSEFARGLGAQTTDLSFRSLRHSGGHVETVRSVFRGLRGARELRRTLRRRPERTVIFAIGIRSGLLSSLAAIGMRRRVVWSVPDLLPPGLLRKSVRLVAAFGPSALICLSRYIAADLVGGWSRLRERTVVVHPGIDASRFDPVGARPGTPRAAIVGHISPVKRTELAVEVAGRVRREVPEFRLVIIGAAQFRDEDKALERSLRARVEADPVLRETVEFCGRVADVAEALEECGLLFHARDDEPFGMVMVEAMAKGIPVVAPSSGGALEIVEDGVTGLLYPPGNVAHAAKSMVRLIREPGLAEQMGQASRRRVENEFQSAAQVEATRRVLHSPADVARSSDPLVSR